MPQEKLEDFINDWEINPKDKSAKSRTGLEISLVGENPDKTIDVEYNNFITWQSDMVKYGLSFEEINKIQNKLTQQFAIIYKEKMKAGSQTIDYSAPQKER